MTDTSALPAQGAEPRSVHMLPALSEDQQQRIEAAIKRRDAADYECFLKLRELIDTYGSSIRTMIEQFDGDEAAELLDECEITLQERTEANEEFLRAVCNRPPLGQEP